MRKTAAALTAALLLLSLILASCGSGETTAPEAAETAGTSVTTQGEGGSVLMPSVKRCSYDGKEFNVLAPGGSVQPTMYDDYFFADEINGDQMNDSIYERRMKVEDYLGVTLRHTPLEKNVMQLGETLSEYVLAGDDTFQLVLTAPFHCNYYMMTNGLLYDWYKIPVIDLEKPWWNQFSNEHLEIAGKLYFALSDFMLSETFAILFNKGIAADFGLDSPYDMVRSGTWTVENMFSLAEQVKADLDGNGVMDFSDQYGFGIRRNARINGFLYSCGIYLTQKDEAGNLRLVINSERTENLVQLFADKIYNTDYCWFWTEENKDALTIDTGRVMFHGEELRRLNSFRGSEVDIGILPYPKYDEEQSRYNALEWNGFMAVPVTIRDPEMVGKVVEMLSYFSGETTVPAYYDVVLGEKLSRDADSREMLELIFSNITADAGVNCFAYQSGMNDLFYTLMKSITSGGSTFASYYAKNEAKALAEIDTLMEIVRNLPN